LLIFILFLYFLVLCMYVLTIKTENA